jgi:hypothetical protein
MRQPRGTHRLTQIARASTAISHAVREPTAP